MNCWGPIEANLRRAVSNATTPINDRFQDGFLGINLVISEVAANGIAIDLTLIEYRLLTELVNHIGTPVPPIDLLERVWGPNYETENLIK